jgi:hypothetical protein
MPSIVNAARMGFLRKARKAVRIVRKTRIIFILRRLSQD